MPVILAVWEAEAGGSGGSMPRSGIEGLASWHTPVIPATQEAEAGESLEPRRWRLQ